MAWWDANSPRNHHRGGTSLLRLSNPKKDLALGDAFPKLSTIRPMSPLSMPDADLSAMDHDRIILSPISEELSSPFAIPAPPLIVHVNIQFTDPVIRHRYNRSYTSSQTFEPTDRICNGLLRRIEHCSEELLTRKDSTALEQYKDGTYDRKSMRFEITFRIVRRGMGEWAERTFRSYQKQPLTVGFTKDIMLAAHRMVGLFLRQHDKDFQWLDGSVVDHSPEVPETVLPSPDGPLSLLCVPRSRFIESSQSFEFVPGYTIQLSFRSRNYARAGSVYRRTIKLSSKQPTPISLLTSENILWKGLHAINRALESKKQEFDAHSKTCRASECPHSTDDALKIELSISNNLGPVYRVYRDIQSNLALFRDPDARDCDEFLRSIEASLADARDDSDSKINELDDFEFKVVELRGHTNVRWSIFDAAKFSCGASASYGRRTIQAALDRIQTGIGDVLRGHNVAVRVSAHKRGHLVLDKAIIAHEKRGRPAEMFSSPEDQQKAFVTRLKTRIQRDIDMVLKDTCSIEDIAEDEEDTQQSTPLEPEAGYLELRGGSIRSASPAKSTRRSIKSCSDSLQGSPTKSALQRTFSLGHRSISSAASVMSAKNLDEFRSVDIVSESGSRRSSMSVQDHACGDRLLFGDSAVSLSTVQTKPQRRFSLLPGTSTSTRVSSASTLICESISVPEEPDEDTSTAGEIVKAELSDADGIPPNDRSDSMTLNEVDNNSAGEPAGMDPDGLLERLARDMTSNVIAHPEVMPPNTDTDCNLGQELVQCAFGEVAGENITRPTMDAFEDAQEFSTGIGLTIPTDTKLDRLTSPAADEYSTAPSTPALSLGGDSSPRHSVLATPTYLRTVSGTKGDSILRDFEPESETEESVADIMDARSRGKEGHENGDQAATEPSPLDASPFPAEPNLTQEIGGSGPDHHGSDKSTSSEVVQNGGLEEESDSAATERGNLLVPPDTTAPAPTPDSDTECCSTPLPPAGCCTDKPKSSSLLEDVFDENKQEYFGAEDVVAESDGRPDFPTLNVRRSAPVDSEDHISEANSDSAPGDDGTEVTDGAVSANNPFVVLVDEVRADPTVSEGEGPEEGYAQDDAETQTEPVGVYPPGCVVSEESVVGQVPEETVPDISLGGSDIPGLVGPEVRDELSEPVNLPRPGPFKLTEETFISPVGTAVVALDAEVLNAVGGNDNFTTRTGAEELDKTTDGYEHSILNKPSSETGANDGEAVGSDRVVGVLDNNIGTDPESVCEPFVRTGTDDGQLQGLEEGVTRGRRASELGEDISGHEYSTGNRVGYAAVCLPLGEGEGDEVSEGNGSGLQGDSLVPRGRKEAPKAEESEALAPCVVFIPDDEITEPEATELRGDIFTEKSPEADGSLPGFDGVVVIVPDDEITELEASELQGADLDRNVLRKETLEADESSPEIAGLAVLISDNEIAETENAEPELQGDIPTEKSPEAEESQAPAVVVIEQEIVPGPEPSKLQAEEAPAIVVVEQLTAATGDEISEKGRSETEAAGDHITTGNQCSEMENIITEDGHLTPTIAETPGVVVIEEKVVGANTDNQLLENIAEHSSFPEIGGVPAAVVIEQVTTSDETSEKDISHSKSTGDESPAAENISVILPSVVEAPVVLAIETETEDIPPLTPEPEANPDTPIEPEILPTISVKDYETPSAPYNTNPEPAPSSDIGAESETTPKRDGAVVFDPIFLAPISDLEVGRTSVDTIRCSFEDFAPEEIEEPRYQSRPQTAGYLGLGDARRIKVGLGGGRGRGVRRYSLPLQYILDGDVSGVRNGSVDGGKENGVVRGLRADRHRHRHGREEEMAEVELDERSAEEAIYDGPLVVPRMMMLLAGVVAVGKILKGSGTGG